jgi:hypothetical protein
MISIYINSLYNLLVRNNAILLYWQSFCHAISMTMNYRKNMQHAQVKLHRLEHQVQTVETYINHPRAYNESRFNVTR